MDHNEIGIQALTDGKVEVAVEAFVKAVEEEPKNAVGYINLGNVFASLGDVEKAEPFFQEAIVLDEEAGTAYYGLANLYYNSERYEEASKLYEQAIRKGVEQADAYFMLGKSLERTDNPKLALPYLQRAVELAPDDLEGRLAYAIILANLELFEEAGNELRFILKEDEQNADAHYNMGFLYAVSTDEKELALYHLKQAFTINEEYEQAREIYNMIKSSDQ